MVNRTEETLGATGAQFASLGEETDYKEWVGRLSGELDFMPPNCTASHPDCVGLLIGQGGEPGQLSPRLCGLPYGRKPAQRLERSRLGRKLM